MGLDAPSVLLTSVDGLVRHLRYPLGSAKVVPFLYTPFSSSIFLQTLFLVSDYWRLVSDAHVRSAMVVEAYISLHLPKRVHHVFEHRPSIDVFCLYDAIHPLRYAIVRRVVILRHADGDIVRPKQVRVCIAAVLSTSVRVVYQAQEIRLSRLPYGHAQGLQREDCLQGFGQTPAHDLMGVSVRDDMQVAAAIAQSDICYVTDPQLVRTCRNKALYQVLVLVIAMVRVRRCTWLRLRKPKIVRGKEVIEPVPSRNPALAKHILRHQPKLVPAYARVYTADFAYG